MTALRFTWDSRDYTEKLTAILQNNKIKSLTLVRMEAPCCGGLEQAAKQAMQQSGKFISRQVFTLSTDGKILEKTRLDFRSSYLYIAPYHHKGAKKSRLSGFFYF